MAEIGDVLIHHATGERVTVLAHTPEALTLEDLWPVGHVVPAHRHPTLAETWRVLDGHVSITIGSQQHTLYSGDTIVAPPDVAHAARNLGAGPARVEMTLAPAGRWLEVVARLFAGQDPRDLLRAYPDELALPSRS